MRFFLMAMAILVAATPASAKTQRSFDLSVTTFNLKFFGLAGSPSNSPSQEDRYSSVKRHLQRHNLLTDVIAFQEVVDVWGLQNRVLGSDYNCYSYNSSDPKHIHVVVCVRDYLRFRTARDDRNYTLENVGMDHYRPAVHGIVETASGDAVAHIINVHLKAHDTHSAVRAEQVEMIANYLSRSRERNVPVVITGDFNTHGYDVNDFNRIFRSKGLSLREVETPAWYTFRVPEQGYKFDRFWMSNGVQVKRAPYVEGPCNGAHSEYAIERYNEEVSDHCAVRVELSLDY